MTIKQIKPSAQRMLRHSDKLVSMFLWGCDLNGSGNRTSIMARKKLKRDMKRTLRALYKKDLHNEIRRNTVE